MNVNDAWYEFTAKRGRSLEILRTRVPHYGYLKFCVGDYLVLPPGVKCSNVTVARVLKDAVEGAGPYCKYPKGFYRGREWTYEAHTWVYKAMKVDALPGVNVTDEETWDYLHEKCGLYRFTNYKFGRVGVFPLVFNKKIMLQYHSLRYMLTMKSRQFKNTFAVVHWRRGDEITRYGTNESLPLNCQSVEVFLYFIQQLREMYALSHNIYISTNEENITSLSYLESHGLYTFRSIIGTPQYKHFSRLHKVAEVEMFLFDVNMMVDSVIYVFFGYSQVFHLVKRLKHQKKQNFVTKTLMVRIPANMSGHVYNESQLYKATAFIKDDI